MVASLQTSGKAAEISDSKSVAVAALVIGIISIGIACAGLIFLCGYTRKRAEGEKISATRSFKQEGIKIRHHIPKAKKVKTALDL